MAHTRLPHTTQSAPARTRGLLWVVACLSAAALWPSAHAQGVFRVVGPDGKVTFTDRPPSAPTGPSGLAGAETSATTDNTGAGGTLPVALRQAMARFPVVLYTGIDCNACDVGRKHLLAQGVPYTEKTVTTQPDADALKQLSGAQTVPYLTIGKQGLKGYNETEWQRYLVAAGYPAKNALPTGYKNPAPAPLAAAAQGHTPARANTPDTSTGTTPAPQAPPSTTTVAPVPSRNTNPAGIRF